MDWKKFSLIGMAILTIIIIAGSILIYCKINELESRLSQLEYKIENPKPEIMPIN